MKRIISTILLLTAACGAVDSYDESVHGLQAAGEPMHGETYGCMARLNGGLFMRMGIRWSGTRSQDGSISGTVTETTEYSSSKWEFSMSNPETTPHGRVYDYVSGGMRCSMFITWESQIVHMTQCDGYDRVRCASYDEAPQRGLGQYTGGL